MWSAPIVIKFLDPPLRKDRFSLQLVYTRLHRFKNMNFRKFPGAHRAPPQTPPSAQFRASLSIWASLSIIGSFASLIQTLPSILHGRFVPRFGHRPWFPHVHFLPTRTKSYRPYSVSVFTKLKFSHFNHLISILTRMWAPIEPSFLIKIMQICTKKAWITT